MHEYAANRYLLRVERELGLLESLAHEGVVLSSLGHLALYPDLHAANMEKKQMFAFFLFGPDRPLKEEDIMFSKVL